MGTWTDTIDAGASGSTRLGEIVNLDIWNQYRMERISVRGRLTGTGQGVGYSLLFQRHTVTNFPEPKQFICLYEDVDIKQHEATLEQMEVYDTDNPNDYTSPHEFNLIQ